jgi:hypothetical protein
MCLDLSSGRNYQGIFRIHGVLALASSRAVGVVALLMAVTVGSDLRVAAQSVRLVRSGQGVVAVQATRARGQPVGWSPAVVRRRPVSRRACHRTA